MTLEQARGMFPCRRSGRIYLNHANLAPVADPVREGVDAYLDLRADGCIDDFEKIDAELERGKARVGELINMPPDRVGFLDNTSNAINLLAGGLPWKRGDRVLLNDVEFPANVYPFLALADRGVETDFVRAREGVVSAEDVISAITPRTRLVALSFVQFLSGYRADLEAIGAVCKDRGVILSVDVIQGVGALRFDAKAVNADFVAAGTHKWTFGLMGLSYFGITEELQSQIVRRPCGWRSVVDQWNLLDYKLEFRESADTFQTGNTNMAGLHAFMAGTGLLRDVGYETVERAVLENADLVRERLLELGLEPLGAEEPPERRSGIVTVPVPDADTVRRALADRKIHVSARGGAVRFSPHFHNTREEIDEAIDALKELL
jgi:selenocysteine lyase/cysteine desulfurase